MALFDASSAAIIVAHPDDETIGAGALMRRLRRLILVHVTDGAPRNMRDARACGFDRSAEYAAARRRELEAALRAGGISADLFEIGIADQEASFHLVELARRLAELLRIMGPALLLTQPYEGGHPDHDATAFAAHAACRLIDEPPSLFEMTAYHANGGGTIAVGGFLPNGEPPTELELNEAEREVKRRMIDAFATQRATLAPFEVGVERFRPAPEYDFSRPPHPGELYYERFDWGMTGARWRSLARAAQTELDG